LETIISARIGPIFTKFRLTSDRRGTLLRQPIVGRNRRNLFMLSSFAALVFQNRLEDCNADLGRLMAMTHLHLVDIWWASVR